MLLDPLPAVRAGPLARLPVVPDERGERAIYVPLAREIVRQAGLMERLADPAFASVDVPPDMRVLDPVAVEVAEATETAREG